CALACAALCMAAADLGLGATHAPALGGAAADGARRLREDHLPHFARRLSRELPLDRRHESGVRRHRGARHPSSRPARSAAIPDHPGSLDRPHRRHGIPGRRRPPASQSGADLIRMHLIHTPLQGETNMKPLVALDCSAIECPSVSATAPIWQDILAQAMTGELLAAMNYTSL